MPAGETPPPHEPGAPPQVAAPEARRASPGSPAEAFGRTLREVLLQENEVQVFERATIGLEDPAKLSGFRLERRQRVDRDASFNQRVREFSLLPLELPTAADIAAADLPREQLTFLSNLQTAYDSSRTDPQVNQLATLNQRFLQNGDWSLRDRAVRLREALIERETTFNRLAEKAHALVGGRIEPAELAEMETALYSVAPELQAKKPDLSALVLQDPALAAQVLAELQGVVAKPHPATLAPPPASELWPNVNFLERKLVFTAGVDGIIAELKSIDTELKRLDDKIAATIETTDVDSRMLLVGEKVELSTRRDELNKTWHTVAPDEGLYSQLVLAQDQLIRRLMLDVGTGGVLFAACHDAIVEQLDGGLPPTTDERWFLIKEQQDLLERLNAALPEPDPLEAIEMLPDMPPLAAKPEAPPAPKAAAKPKPKAKAGQPGAKPKSGPLLKPKPSLKPRPKQQSSHRHH